MKRIALFVFLAGVVVLGTISVLSWLQSDRDRNGAVATPDPVLAEGVVDVAATVDAEQERLIRSLARAVAGLADGPAKITIDYPIDGSIFPPEIVPPTFLWHDEHQEADRWLIDVALDGGEGHIYVLAKGDPPPRGKDDPRCFGPTNQPFEPTEYQESARSWTPGEQVWSAIKAGSVKAVAGVTIIGFDSDDPGVVLSRGQMELTTSADEVGAPIFYRDVPLMPNEGEDGVIKPLVPEALPLIEWRLKDISRPDSRVVLTDMPSCANCHSFSADGKTLAMDIDGPTGDKGAYAISRIERDMTIGPDEIITWNSFEDKPEGHKTIGFLSQVSPDGQYAITTVNEAIYVANFTDYRFLQVFYPTGGILAYYSRQTGQMQALPGADDTDYVQCDPVWSPDGEWIVFARAKARDSRVKKLASYANDPIELQIQYDLYRVAFNDGLGGQPERIEGASANGMSNTFPKVSPDGKWIVFVKCRNGQLMRPDSELWIVPLAGGQARKMNCNTGLMNSWHSFSPNGRWMVFSSKSNTPYTQMFLTHIDEDGNDSPAILIPNATATNRAVNIPEFINIGYDELVSISAPSVEYYRHLALGTELTEKGRYEEAIVAYHKALALEPTSTRINNNLATCLVRMGRVEEGADHFRKCLETDPRNMLALLNLARVLTQQGKADEAIELYHRAIEISPQRIGGHLGIAATLARQNKTDESIEWCKKALEIAPSSAVAYYVMGRTHYMAGQLPQAIENWHRAIELEPDYAAAHHRIGTAVAQLGDLTKAIEMYRAALAINPAHAPALFSLGNALSQQGKPNQAIEQYRRALRASPRSIQILNTLGIALARRGQVDEAIELFQRALEIDPDNEASRQNLQTALDQKNGV